MEIKKGDRIRELRTKRGITQTELAKLLDTTKQTVSKYENGIITNIPSDKIEAMAKIFNVSPEYILCWDEKMLTVDESEILSLFLPLDKARQKQALDYLRFLSEKE